MKKLCYSVLSIAFIILIMGNSQHKRVTPYEMFKPIQTYHLKGKDAFVHSFHPDTNYGKSELLQSLSWTINGDSVVIRSFINFDFSSLPKRCKIIEARLSLCEYHTSGTPTQGHSHLSGSNACYIRRVISKWNENTITWNNQPETTDINEVTIPQDTLPTQDYTDIDVTNLIRDIINNPKKSYGLTIRLVDENNYRAMYFASSNYSNTLKHPALILKIQ